MKNLGPTFCLSVVIINLLWCKDAEAQRYTLQDVQSLYIQGQKAFERAEFQDALIFWEKSLKMSRALGNLEAAGSILSSMARACHNLGENLLALDYLQQSWRIKKALGDRHGEGAELNNIGLILAELKEYLQALDYFQQALAIKKELSDSAGVAGTLTNTGMVYYDLNEYAQALKYYHGALLIQQAMGMQQETGDNFQNLGLVYLRLSQHRKALEYHQQALEIHQSLGDKRSEGVDLNNIGVIYKNLAKFDDALDYYQQALKIYQGLEDKKTFGDILTNIGVIYEIIDEDSNAIAYNQHALEIRREIEDLKGISGNLSNIGIVYGKLGHHSQDLNYQYQALEIAKDIDDKIGIGRYLHNIGGVYQGLGQYLRALDYYQQALNIKKELDDKKEISSSLINIGKVYDRLGDYSQALDYFQNALKLTKEIGNKESIEANLTAIGDIYEILGDYSKALDYYHQAHEIAKDIGLKRMLGSNLNRVGIIYYDLGDYSHALGYFQQALEIKKDIKDKEGIAAILSNLGLINSELEKYSLALNYYEEALTIRKELGNKHVEGETIGNIGDIYLKQGRLQDALLRYQEIDDTERLGWIHNKMGMYDKALEYFSQALSVELNKKYKCSQLMVRLYIRRGGALVGLNQWEGAIADNLAAIEIVEKVREKLKDKEHKRDFLAIQLQPYENLVSILFNLQSKGQQPIDTLRRWGENYAEIALHFVEKAKARALVEMLAKARTEKLAHLLSKPLADKEARLTAYLSNLENQSDQAFEKGKEAQEVLARNIKETRYELEALIAQIQKDYPDYAALRYPEAITVAKLPLHDNERLLEYQVTEDATYLFVAQKGKVDKVLKIPISRKDLEDKVRHFRSAFEKLEKFEDLNRFNPLEAQELYNLLVAPALEKLPRNQHLILVPDGPLHLLPFEVLVVDTTNATKTINPDINVTSYQGLIYLADQWELSYYQSATVMAVNRIGKPAKTSWQKPFFAMGDPVFDENDPRALGRKVAAAIKVASAETVMPQEVMLPKKSAINDRGFPIGRLPETTDEIAAIARLLGVAMNSPDIKLGLAANEMALKQMNLLGYQYLTFATHGFLADDIPYIQEPALMLTQVDKGEEDGFLTMSEVLGLRLNAELVTLSACGTGLGKQVKGEGVVGLSRAFMYAGTKSLLVSLWSVSSKSTEIFMTTFYNYLKQGKGKAAALRRAKQELRNSRFEIELEVSRGIAVKGKTVKIMMEGSHPYFWAPFVLIGEWE